MSDTLFGSLSGQLSALLYPLERAVAVPGALENLLAELGALPDTDTGPLSSALGAVLAEKHAIEALAEQASPSFESIAAVLDGARRAFEALSAIGEAGGPLPQLAGLGRDLTDLLVGAWLAALHPVAHQGAVLLTLVEPELDQPLAPARFEGAKPVRLPYRIDRPRPERLVALLRDPAAVLRAEYGNTLTTAKDADAMAARLFPRVLGLLRELDVSCRYGINEGDEAALADSAPLLAHSLIVHLGQPLNGAVSAQAGAVFAISSADRGDLGLVASPFGTVSRTWADGRIAIALQFSAGVQALAYGRHGLTLLADAGTNAVTGSLTAERTRPPGAPPFIIGSPGGTRVEVADARLKLETSLSEARQSLSLAADVGSSSLIVAPADGDGFLASILPAQGLRVDFSTGLAWSNEHGLTLRGGAGLDASLPVGMSVAGVSVSHVHLGLHVSDGAVDADVTARLGTRIGPVGVSVDGVGVKSSIRFAPGGNLGAADLAVGLKAPSELGLVIDAGPLTGAGALVFDPEREQYAGDVRLRFEGIAVRATGLLTTRLPDGRPGFSLLVLVSAEFPPVQLGLGFMLVGVGGLLGINRTVAVDALRAGLKTGELGAVLSPPDPEAGAGQVVASLASLFPPAAGRHVFAPTARIVWGSPTLITIELCLVLELPAPVRLIVLGRLRAVLPDEREAVVRIGVDLLGVIDFDRGEAAVDATLVDSRLAQFALTGDLALRMSWGEQPSFLLAVGGFHPRFAAPAGFPALERVAIALADGENPKLRLEAYLALTSNTVQFGARVDLFARAGSFSVGGFLSFDALVGLAPLAFVVDIAAQLAVKVGGHTLLSVSLALTLSGPRPWRARGRASFSILFFDVSFGFDITIGDDPPPALPAPVDVAPLLLAAFADPRSWSAGLPAAAGSPVTLRAAPAGSDVLAHPLATLEVRQRVAPLETTLERFGSSVPSGARRFRITAATLGAVRTTLAPLTDRFAPAQFRALSDDEKLSAPSFEVMPSGATVGTDGVTHGAPVTVNVSYEQLVTGLPRQRVPMSGDVFAALTAPPPSAAPAFALREAA